MESGQKVLLPAGGASCQGRKGEDWALKWSGGDSSLCLLILCSLPGWEPDMGLLYFVPAQYRAQTPIAGGCVVLRVR